MKYRWTAKDAARLRKVIEQSPIKKKFMAKQCGVKLGTLYGIINKKPRRPGPKLIRELALLVDLSWVKVES